MDLQPWRQKGKCATLSPKESDRLFFPGRGRNRVQAGKKFCQGCPVKTLCRDFAIYYNEDGIWGGTTTKERQEIAKWWWYEIHVQLMESGAVIEIRPDPLIA